MQPNTKEPKTFVHHTLNNKFKIMLIHTTFSFKQFFKCQDNQALLP